MTPLTNAEKREIFTEGAWLLHSRYNSFTPYPETREYVEKEALRRYPDPYEPTILSADDGRVQLRIHPKDGQLQTKFPADSYWVDLPSFWTASLCASLGEIAHEYSERAK